MDERDEHAEPEHPLDRARHLFDRAAPRLRLVSDAINDGSLRETGEALVAKATDIARRADEAVARATAIEGTVIEREAPQAEAVEHVAATGSLTIAPSSTAPWSIAATRVLIGAAIVTAVALVVLRRR